MSKTDTTENKVVNPGAHGEYAVLLVVKSGKVLSAIEERKTST